MPRRMYLRSLYKLDATSGSELELQSQAEPVLRDFSTDMENSQVGPLRSSPARPFVSLWISGYYYGTYT